MSRKDRILGFGLLALAVGLSYLAIDAWACGDGKCKSQVAKALGVIVPTDTEDGWSGASKPYFLIVAPNEAIYFPPPPPEQDGSFFSGDDGDDGH